MWDQTPAARWMCDMGQGNINKFIKQMQLVERDSVNDKPDIQTAYSVFDRIVRWKYKYVTYGKLSEPYYKIKPWLTIKMNQNKLELIGKADVTLKKEMPVAKLNVTGHVTFYARLNASATKNSDKWPSLSLIKESTVQPTRNLIKLHWWGN